MARVHLQRQQRRDCVEAASVKRKVAVRDSKDPDGPELGFTREEWASFVAGVKDGRSDR